MNEKPIRIWVHPDFKRTIKKEAAELGVSVFELTKDIGNESEDILERLRKNDTKGWKKFKVRLE